MIGIDTTKIPEKTKGLNAETKVIPAGPNLGVLVEVIEMGWHVPMFNGKPDVYSSGKRVGQVKDPEFIVMFTVEFPLAEHTGDFPLTWKSSIPYGVGEFVNKVSVTQSILNNTLGRQLTERNKFVKWLNAFKKMIKNPNILSISEAIHKGGIFNVTHREGKPGDDGVKVIHANIDPSGVQPPEQVDFVTREVRQITVPEPKGEYAGIFDWDNPDPVVWGKLSGIVQERIKSSLNFANSQVAAMLAKIPEKDLKPEEHTEEKTPDKPPVPNTPIQNPEQAPDTTMPFNMMPTV